MFKRILLAGLIAVAALAPVAAQNAEAKVSGGDQISFLSGSTTVNLDQGFLTAARSLGIHLRAVFPGRLQRNRATFPIVAGTVDANDLQGEIIHSGGLQLRRGGTTVTARNFIIDTQGQAAVLTAQVSVDGAVVGRIPLFNLDLSGASVSAGYFRVRIGNVGVTLTNDAAAALNGVFGINALAGGLPIGTATVSGFTGFGHEE